MKKRLRPNPSYANVAATVALLLAVGGGTTAIALQGKNTVGTDDIRPGNVTGRDLSRIRVIRRVFTLPPPQMTGDVSSDFFILRCPRGTRVVGGGGGISPSGSGLGWITRTDPRGNGWQITASQQTTQPASVAVTAMCLKRKPGRPV